jgi:hypothetical protein
MTLNYNLLYSTYNIIRIYFNHKQTKLFIVLRKLNDLVTNIDLIRG